MDPVERREQIMSAAIALISERGYWGLSMQDVADACDLTIPGLLHHVGSKTGLLIAVLEQRDTADTIELARQLGFDDGILTVPPLSVPDSLIAAGVTLGGMCDALVQHNARQPEVVRLYAVLEAESLTPDHPAHDYFASRQRIALASFARLAHPDHHADHLAKVALALMDGLQVQWLREPEHGLVERWRAAVAEIPGLRVDGAAPRPPSDTP
ncbi:TetR/AcrR family transcriptional regulator [Cellulomonas cellasea]|uniref:TetR/AcrR family transcriptional regulator n=1 Tax=Cellulomonas cellasea TaxID=43670 RepID=UPI0025A420B3|nr:TetR/AcrR family transcriptional regulator [Cellulomonas cellasea]MDM8085928.1 TetR/AcrR family transcriptional regulator [Cellulomonas cellasea]